MNNISYNKNFDSFTKTRVENEFIAIEGSQRMADIIAINEKLLLVIERFGISLGFGDKTVKEICRLNNLDHQLVLLVMNVFHNQTYPVLSHLSLDMIPGLIDYLKNGHHYYLKQKLPYIENLIERFINNTDNPDTRLILKFFNEYANEVNEHMKYEDDIVFPYCIALYNIYNKKENSSEAQQYTVESFISHHEDIDEKLDDLMQLLIKHFPPTTDRFYRNMMLIELFNLQYDLLDHSNIEDKILLPAIEQLEFKVG